MITNFKPQYLQNGLRYEFFLEIFTPISEILDGSTFKFYTKLAILSKILTVWLILLLTLLFSTCCGGRSLKYQGMSILNTLQLSIKISQPFMYSILNSGAKAPSLSIEYMLSMHVEYNIQLSIEFFSTARIVLEKFE